MTKSNKIGVMAIFDVSNFTSNVQSYISQLNKATDATEQSAGGATAAGGAAGGALAIGMGIAMVAAMALVAAVTKVISVLSDAVKAVAEFSKEVLLLAARTQELTVVAQLLGQRMGYSSDEISTFIEDMREYGIRADVAAGTIAQMARYHLDLAEAVNLARTAQDAAVLVNKDSSAALDRLTYGIVTHEKRVIRMAGAMVDLEGAYIRFRKENNRTTDDLTEQERIQIALNEVIKEGARIQGVYEAALSTPGKQLRTLKREVQDLKIELGTPFLGAMTHVIAAFRRLVAALEEAVKEGGALYPIIIWLAAVMDLLGYALSKMVDKAIAYGKGFFDALTTWWEKTGRSAFKWGFGIVKNLALGIINAAKTVLIFAIKYLGKVLTSWLSTRSPPKILPDIAIWGKETMEIWLKAFSKADFSALKDIQAPLRDVLDLLADAGRLAAKKVGKIWADLSEQLIKDFAKGNIAASTLQNIANATGRLGSALVKLIKDEFALSKAITAAADAQKRFNDAVKKEEEAEAQVKSLTREYNDLLRAGAGSDVLKTKLAEINAAEDGLTTARKERTESEIALELAEKMLELMEEQVDLQKELIDQMLALAKARVEAAKAGAEEPDAGGGGAGAEELFEEDLGFGEMPPIDLATPLQEAIDAAKKKIRKALQLLWIDIKIQFRLAGMEIKQAFIDYLGEPLQEAIAIFTDPDSSVWEKIKSFGGLLFEMFKAQFEMFWGILLPWITGTLIPWIVTAVTETLPDLLASLLEWAIGLSETISQGIIGSFQNLGIQMRIEIDKLIPIIAGWISEAGPMIAEWATQAWTDITEAWEDIGIALAQFGVDILTSIGEWVSETWGLIEAWGSDIYEEITTAISDTVEEVGTKIAELATEIGTGLSDALTTAKTYFDRFMAIGASIIDSIKQGVINGIVAFIGAIAGAIARAIAAAKAAAGIKSPSKPFIEIGSSFMIGLEKGIFDTADRAFGASADAVSTAIAGSIAAATVPRRMSTVTNTTNIPMNVNIHSGMDAVQLRALIREAVSRELR